MPTCRFDNLKHRLYVRIVTDEEKDREYIEALNAREDKMCERVYTTRQAALYALKHRWGIEYKHSLCAYAVEQRDADLGGGFCIVPDYDHRIRGAQAARRAEARINRLFEPSAEKVKREKKKYEKKTGPREKLKRGLDFVRVDGRPKGAVDCTYGPHNNWGAANKMSGLKEEGK